jgi:hypothetical protein
MANLVKMRKKVYVLDLENLEIRWLKAWQSEQNLVNLQVTHYLLNLFLFILQLHHFI